MTDLTQPIALEPVTDGQPLVSLPVTTGRHRAAVLPVTSYVRYSGRHRGTPRQWYLVGGGR